MKSPSISDHLKSFLLPITVAGIIPYLLTRHNIPFVFNTSIWFSIISIVFLGIGLCLFFSTVRLFHTEGRGTLAPWTPTSGLVIKGPYRYCRNPMITSVLTILIGETILFNSLGILLWAVLFFAINFWYFVYYEEPGLVRRFGEGYEHYKKSVPRWIPRMKPYRMIIK